MQKLDANDGKAFQYKLRKWEKDETLKEECK